MSKRIYLSPPHMSGIEQKFIDNAFKSNFIAPIGQNINDFENEIRLFLDNEVQATALNSGTSAIHLALKLLGVNNGDLVICQSNTFVASVSPAIQLGAKPVFIDSETQTYNLCPSLLEKSIKDCIKQDKKPKAIIAVHLFGMPYQVEKINDISKLYNVPVIEDAAEAFGSAYKNKKCGTLSDISVISFNGNKIITTSGGGALITKNEKLKQRAVFLATQARDKSLDNYSHSEIGFNYRMSNVLAGIGIGQMKVLEKYVRLRRRNFNHYYNALKDIPEIKFINEPVNYFSNRWLNCIILDSNVTRNDLQELLEKNDIETRPAWKPMHLQPVFKDELCYVNGNSESLFINGLCLPSGSNLSIEDLNRVTNIIKSYFSV